MSNLLSHLAKIFEAFKTLIENLKTDEPLLILEFNEKLNQVLKLAQDNKYYDIRRTATKMMTVLLKFQAKEIDLKGCKVTLESYCTSLTNYLDVEKLKRTRKDREKLKSGIIKVIGKILGSIKF